MGILTAKLLCCINKECRESQYSYILKKTFTGKTFMTRRESHV